MNGSSLADDGRHVDEGTVHAWLDGQLSGEEEARISAHVAGCADCAAVVAEARGHIAASTRILNALDGVPARVVARATRRVSRWHLRAAAAIVVMAIGTAIVVRGPASSLRSMYEAPPVVATHLPQAPAAVQQVPSAPSPSADEALRSAGPMVRPEAKHKSMPEKSPQEEHALQKSAVKEDNLHPEPETEALAAKARRQSSASDRRAMAPASTASALSLQSPSAAVAGVAAPAADSTILRARAAAGQPTVENALQGKVSPSAAAPPAQIAADAEARRITGRVVEADEGKPIPAASVVVSGTTVGSNTSDSGSFALEVPPHAKVLTARRIGYLAQTVPLTPGATDYTIPMKKDVLQLEAQIATGAATTASSQSAASTASGRVDSMGPVNGKLGAVAGASAACREQVVRVPAPGGAGADSVSIRLTGVPSINANYPGFVVRPVPDTSGAEFGRWQPLGTDSAFIVLNTIAGPSPRRVGCKD